MIYAVIDTNVFVSALFSKNINVATVKVLDAIFQGKIVPLYNDEITVPIRNHNVKNPPINTILPFFIHYTFPKYTYWIPSSSAMRLADCSVGRGVGGMLCIL